MKKQIKAEIVADSISPQGNRITTFLLTYPRIIHAELMTHRLFSRNSASSRAIPFEKMVKMVEEDPFIPIAWQKDHKGMQGTEYFTDNLSIQFARSNWLSAKDNAIKGAKSLYSTENGYESVTKQICNRLLEPFMWHTVLVTATEWDNFFNLRCPKYRNLDSQLIYKSKKDFLIKEYLDFSPYKAEGWYSINESQAEIHIQALAEAMWDVMNESTPKKLQPGEWHIPFGDKIDLHVNHPFISKITEKIYNTDTMNACLPTIDFKGLIEDYSIKIATARCARLSYMTFDNEIDYEKDIQLHDKLLLDKHMSPFEHCARAMSDDEYSAFYKGEITPMDGYLIGRCKPARGSGWCNNFKGFIQYRYMIENNYN